MKKGQDRILTVIAASAILIAGAFFAGRALQKKNFPEPCSRDAFLLDTFCTVTVYDGGKEEALLLAMEEISRFDALFDAEKESSDLYRINHRNDAGQTENRVKISADTARMLKRAAEIEELSGGALLTSIRPVTELWDFKEKKQVPDPVLLEKALRDSHAASWHLEEETEEDAVFVAEDPAVKMEAGAFAKGYIADRVREVLRDNGVTSAIIDLGGNIQTLGGKPDGTPFSVGIRDPKGEKSYVEILTAKDTSVVTAGSYERFFIENGVRYHHILDPETGYPVQNGLESVTVTGPESVICDALATACFVLGPEKGAGLLTTYNTLHQTAYEGRFLTEDGTMTASF